MSDGLPRTIPRVGLALVAAVDVVAAARFVATTPRSPLAHPGAPAWLLALGGEAALVVPVAALGLAALISFARGRRTLTAGSLALLVLALLNESRAALSFGPSRADFYCGALLLGWLVGTAFARRLRTRRATKLAFEEPFAEAGAVGVLAAIYVSAGLSKLLASGISWADQMTLRGIILAHHSISDTSPAAAYAHFVVARPMLSQAFSTLTIIVQLGAVLYLVHPRLRPIWGVLILGFHLNVGILTGIGYLEAQVLTLLFAFPWPAIVARLRGHRRPEAEADPVEPIDDGRARRAAPVAFLAVAAVVGVAWVSPIREYTSLHHERRNLDQEPSEGASAPRRPPSRP
jgi:hypothetical protein